ncbi:MAG: hypothetical protein EB015_09670 [Methylocystaceae bacterium]|jgi:hypothetical protein|nr:hypothetical protein [Methylocystaceae bacterium]
MQKFCRQKHSGLFLGVLLVALTLPYSAQARRLGDPTPWDWIFDSDTPLAAPVQLAKKPKAYDAGYTNETSGWDANDFPGAHICDTPCGAIR